MENNIPTLVKAKKTKQFYLYHGENKFENLATGGKGTLSDDDAKKVFVIPITANKMAMENPVLIDLIRELKLIQDDSPND
jgi:hypothetical protein